MDYLDLLSQILKEADESKDPATIESKPVETGLPQRIVSALDRLKSVFLSQAKKSANFSQLSDNSQEYLVNSGLFLLGYQVILSLDPEGEQLLIDFNKILSSLFKSRLRPAFSNSKNKADSKLTSALNRLRPKFDEIANGWADVEAELTKRKQVKDEQKNNLNPEDTPGQEQGQPEIESGQVNSSTELPKPD